MEKVHKTIVEVCGVGLTLQEVQGSRDLLNRKNRLLGCNSNETGNLLSLVFLLIWFWQVAVFNVIIDHGSR